MSRRIPATVNTSASPDDGAVTLVVAWRRSKGFEFGKVRATARFANELRSIAEVAEQRLKELTQKAYAVGDDIEDDEYMTSPLYEPKANDPIRTVEPGHLQQGQPSVNEAPSVPVSVKPQELQQVITTDNPAAFRNSAVALGSLPTVGAAFLAEKRIAFYMIVIGTTIADRLLYIRHLNPLRLAKPGHIMATLGDTLDKVNSPIFAIDDRIDLIVRNSQFDIFNKNFFDSMFFGMTGAGDDLDNVASESLGALPMAAETRAMLVERSRARKRSRRKLLEINSSGHLATVTVDHFKAALQEHGYDVSRFIDTEGNIYADENDSDLLLEILNEDLFKGALTRRPLAASKKHELG